MARALRGENSYDFVRFCAASAVLFSHHFDLAGFPEPQLQFYGEDLGQLAVAVFFCLSGFLIAQSLETSSDPARFFAARVLRIFPNLAVVLVITSSAALLLYVNFAHLQEHIAFVFRNLTMFVGGTVFLIPGVLDEAVRQSLNDPLWTLPYELWLYVALFAVYFVAKYWKRRTLLLLAAACIVLRPVDTESASIGPLELDDLVNLASYFFAGAALALIWTRLEPHALGLGCLGLAGLVLLGGEYTLLKPPLLALCVLGLGSSRAMAWFARGGDASYGMYVFAWPVQQLSLHLIGSFWASLAFAFCITVAVGYATWHGFEKRALSCRDRMTAAIRTALATNRPKAGKPLSREPV